MSTTTTCDHCGEPITKDNGRVDITVSDRTRLSGRDAAGHEFPHKDWQPPKDLGLTLDLHRSCYVEHYLPALRAIDPSNDDDGKQ